MEPKSALEILTSPEGIVVLPFAVLIDAVGIVLIIFGLDDFCITDIIAWSFLGFWGMFRSQVTVKEQAPSQMPSSGHYQQKAAAAKKIRKFEHAAEVAAEKSQEAARAAELAKKSGDVEKAALETQRAQKFAKAARTARNMKWLEFIPYIGALPLWTISTYMTIKYS